MNKQKGFTLIEIILVIAIISMVSIFGFSAMNNFNSSQNFDNSSDDFINLIHEAKSNTLSQVKVGGNCATTDLIGYRISIDNAVTPNTYSMDIVCGSAVDLPATWTYANVLTNSFSDNTTVEMTPAANFMFVVPNALVANQMEISINYLDQNKIISVATTGAIFQ